MPSEFAVSEAAQTRSLPVRATRNAKRAVLCYNPAHELTAPCLPILLP
ncbi:hypothetical protein [Treponema endosymbiont of Eucomonympha sp.]|nr:hypothetical protein [Treponema endosymbiont of Eucomonympha sp.]